MNLLKNKLMNELFNTIKDSQPIYTQKTAMKYLAIYIQKEKK